MLRKIQKSEEEYKPFCMTEYKKGNIRDSIAWESKYFLPPIIKDEKK